MNAILENLVGPLVRRLGTALATALVLKGLPSELVEPFVNYLCAAVLVGVDLLVARYYRRAVVASLIGFDLGSPFGDVVGPSRTREGD